MGSNITKTDAAVIGSVLLSKKLPKLSSWLWLEVAFFHILSPLLHYSVNNNKSPFTSVRSVSLSLQTVQSSSDDAVQASYKRTKFTAARLSLFYMAQQNLKPQLEKMVLTTVVINFLCLCFRLCTYSHKRGYFVGYVRPLPHDWYGCGPLQSDTWQLMIKKGVHNKHFSGDFFQCCC